jgi:hypothetical protein
MASTPFDEAELAIVRPAFTRRMMAVANVEDGRVEQALASSRPPAADTHGASRVRWAAARPSQFTPIEFGIAPTKHDPEKWSPVFGKDLAQK